MPHPAGFDSDAIGFDDPYVSFDADSLADEPPPTAPANFTATPASTSQVNLSWDGVQGATSYVIERTID